MKPMTEPETAWTSIVHEVRATGPEPLNAAAVSAFAIIVPDHADIDVRRDPQALEWTLVGTWPHEDSDNIERPLLGGRATWGGAPVQQHTTDLGAHDCPAWHMARPCIKADGHDGAHVYRSALAVADDLEEQQCAQGFGTRRCERDGGHDGVHSYPPEPRRRSDDALPEHLVKLAPQAAPWKDNDDPNGRLAGHVTTADLGGLVGARQVQL